MFDRSRPDPSRREVAVHVRAGQFRKLRPRVYDPARDRPRLAVRMLDRRRRQRRLRLQRPMRVKRVRPLIDRPPIIRPLLASYGNLTNADR